MLVCMADKRLVPETILIVEYDILVRMPIAQYLVVCRHATSRIGLR